MVDEFLGGPDDEWWFAADGNELQQQADYANNR